MIQIIKYLKPYNYLKRLYLSLNKPTRVDMPLKWSTNHETELSKQMRAKIQFIK